MEIQANVSVIIKFGRGRSFLKVSRDNGINNGSAFKNLDFRSEKTLGRVFSTNLKLNLLKGPL